MAFSNSFDWIGMSEPPGPADVASKSLLQVCYCFITSMRSGFSPAGSTYGIAQTGLSATATGARFGRPAAFRRFKSRIIGSGPERAGFRWTGR